MTSFARVVAAGVSIAAGASVAQAQLFTDGFNYPNGDLTTVSGGTWVVQNSGTPAIQVANDAVLINQPSFSSPSNERVAAALGTTYSATGTDKAVFASFDATWSKLPVSTTGSYFFNFSVSTANTTTFYGRIGANLNNAAAGSFRVATANANWSKVNAIGFPEDLSLGVAYKIVIKYDLTTRDTTLWINPSSELSTSVTATDAPSGSQSSIAAVSLREGVTNTGGGAPGEVSIDDLEVGPSFGLVTVPEPGAYPMAFAVGLGGLAWLIRRRSK